MIPFTVWFWDTLLLAWVFEAATDMLEADAGEGVPDDGVVPGDDGVPEDGGAREGEVPIGDFDAEDDIVDPLVDRAEADGIDISRPGDDTLAIAGASAGGLILVGLALGFFGK